MKQPGGGGGRRFSCERVHRRSLVAASGHVPGVVSFPTSWQAKVEYKEMRMDFDKVKEEVRFVKEQTTDAPALAVRRGIGGRAPPTNTND